MLIKDVCDAPAVITALQPPNLSYKRSESGSLAETLNTFMSNTGSALCTLNTCRVVRASGGVCAVTTRTWFSVGSQTGITLTLTIDTSLVHVIEDFCLECTTNNSPTTTEVSLPFSLVIIDYCASPVVITP